MKGRKIHIAFIIHNPSPVPYFNWFADFASQSETYKFSFVFFNENNESVKEYMQKYGCDVYHIPFDNSNKKKSLVSGFLALYKLLKKIKPDITHSHLFYDGVITTFAAKLAGVKSRIQTKQSTGFNWYYAPKAVPLDWFKNFWATHLIAVSGECRDFLIQKEGVEPSKISLVNHGIDFAENTYALPEQINFIREKYNSEGKILIVMIARYIEWKGYDFYIDAASQILKNRSDVKFLGIGNGPLQEKLQQKIDRLGISDSFQLTGYVDRNLIPAVYQNATVYVHTALREPFGFVLAEAMANGLPMVSTSTGAARDAITHKKNGYLVSYESVDEIVNGIDFLLNLDPGKLKAMGQLAAETAKEMFSFEKMKSGYLEVYEREIKKRHIR